MSADSDIQASFARESPASTGAATGRWTLYGFLLAAQSAGAFIILWKGVPIYRQIVVDPSRHEARTAAFVWLLLAVALIQGGYWIRLKIHPQMPQRSNILLAHIFPFLGRISLIFSTSCFSVIFFANPQGLHLPASRYPALIGAFFSMFCFSQELERLGKALSPHT